MQKATLLSAMFLFVSAMQIASSMAFANSMVVTHHGGILGYDEISNPTFADGRPLIAIEQMLDISQPTMPPTLQTKYMIDKNGWAIAQRLDMESFCRALGYDNTRSIWFSPPEVYAPFGAAQIQVDTSGLKEGVVVRNLRDTEWDEDSFDIDTKAKGYVIKKINCVGHLSKGPLKTFATFPTEDVQMYGFAGITGIDFCNGKGYRALYSEIMEDTGKPWLKNKITKVTCIK